MRSLIKTFTLLALLTVTALAATYQANYDLFSADFGGKVTVERPEKTRWGNVRMYLTGNKESFKGNMVYAIRSMKPTDALTILKREHPALTRGTDVKRRFKSYDALRWNGVSGDGLPVEVLIVQTNKRTYLVASVSIDTAEQKRFLESFDVID